jgi:prepilin-type N-terminal cleavage/methylation domain-containing protein
MFFGVKGTLKSNKGFGLLEMIISIAVFLLVAVSIYGGFVQILKVLSVLKTKTLMANLANEQIEIVRNLPYSDVGIVAGLPSGKIPRNQNISRDGVSFAVAASIQDIDDPFDGQRGEIPNDLSPADYKLVEFTIQCRDCNYSEAVKYYTKVSPQALETQGNNGALFIWVFDSSGNPLSGANVNVKNDQASTTINIDEITNIDGLFSIVDAPTGTNAYKITVTKSGYSTERTYAIGSVGNPNPEKPDATVVSGQVTQLSFSIDKLSDLSVRTKDSSCIAVPNINFKISGSKTIGENVLKYSSDKNTSGSGLLDILGLEWDNYLFEILDNDFDLVGSSNLFPLNLNPGSNQDLDLILADSDPNTFLVQVIDSQTGLPLSDAEVKLKDSSNDENILTTGKGFMGQTDWSGVDQYFSQNNLEDSNPAGVLTLAKLGENYLSNGELISNTFDIGTTTNFGILTWGNASQPTNTEVKFQIATNEILTSTSTWDFVGPNGTAGSFYTNPNETIGATHNGHQYLRYKIFMNTTDPSFTPQISNVAFTYNSECAPPGQVAFQNLDDGNYSLEINKNGYATYSVQNINLNQDWQMHSAIMTP